MTADARGAAPPRVLILGPLLVAHGGTTAPVRGRTAPKLLAVLAADGGVVALPALIDAIWAGDPPATAHRQVQNTVSALRRGYTDTLLTAVGRDYRLGPQVEVDAHRFTAAAAEAAELTAAGRLEPALDALAEALRWWRGPALDGLDLAARLPAARVLAEQRLTALEDHAELSLRLRRPVDTAELRRLLRTDPGRQRLAGALMLALHREDRGGEALAVFERLRTRLADKLGIDPAPELRDRYEAIRDGREPDPVPNPRHVGTTAPARPSAAARRPVPAQLPADITGFTGRERQLAALDELPAGGLSVVTGPGGAGKTALALRWAHRNRSRFPDGQLYLNLRGFGEGEPVTPIDALGRLLVALGVPADRIPADLDTAASRLRTVLADQRTLRILDNARDAGQVSPLIPDGDGNLALVTSRHRLASLTALNGARQVAVETLTRDESLRLLEHMLGADLLAAEAASADRLATLCAGLPLALRIAAANYAGRPGTGLPEFTAELDGANRLDLLAVDGDPRAAVAAVFEQSVAVLDTDTRSAFLRLGLLPCETISLDLTAAVLGVAAPAAADLLRRLESAHLVEQHDAKRYRLHDLVRAYAQTQAVGLLSDTDRESVMAACIRWHFDTRRNQSGPDFPNLIALADAWGEREDGWRLAVALSHRLLAIHDVNVIRSYIDRSLALVEQRRDVEGQYHMHSTLARLQMAAGNADGAVAAGERALVHAELLGGDELSVANATFGASVGLQGDYLRAERYLRAAIGRFEARRDPQTSSVATNLANTYRRLGRFAEAERYLRLSEKLYRDHSNETGALNSRIGLALVFLNLGELDRTRELFGECMEAAVRVGSGRLEVLCRLGLGLVLSRSGRASDAERELRAAIQMAEGGGIEADANKARLALAMLLARLNRTDEALVQLHVRTTADMSAMGAGRQLDHALASCVVLARAGRIEQAIAEGELARELATRHHIPLDEAHALAALADARERAGDTAGAGEDRRHALAIFAELGARAETSVRLAAAPGPGTGSRCRRRRSPSAGCGPPPQVYTKWTEPARPSACP